MHTRPNILFIFTDQQTLGALSCAGNRFVNTPHLDTLAAGGLRFERSYCTAPVCSPARASLVTGRMPHETGVVYNDTAIDPAIPTMGAIFRDAGYNTVWQGKWHLPASYPQLHRDPFIPGFETIRLPEGINLARGADTDAFVADEACHFLTWEAAKQRRPWLMAVSLHNPHDICAWTGMPPVRHANLAGYPPLPPNVEICAREAEFMTWARQRDHYGNELNHTRTWDETQWRAYLHAYYALTEQVDLEIGRILGALRANGWEDNTLVIFTSDHGEGCAAHRWVVKLSLYENPVTVPFILRWKGVLPEGVVDATHLVSGLDVLPTMCAYAGIAAPPMTGQSLKPLIEQPALPGREFVVAELAPDPKDTSLHGRMLRSARYKYIAFSKGRDPEMLFDLQHDPGEMQNIACEPALQTVVASHRAHLAAWCMQTNDPFVLPARP